MSHGAVRVAILGINYAPEATGIAPYTTGLAEGLRRRGHDVLVVTGYPHYPEWRRGPATAGIRQREVIDGVPVRRLNHHVPTGGTWTGRAAMELSFGAQLVTTRWGGPDVVICISPPLLATAMAAFRARLTWRRPAIGVVVHDLYTRGAEETGAGSATAARVLRRVEAAAFRSADEVVVIHPGFIPDLVGHLGVDPGRVNEIRNWNHVDAPDPSASEAFRRAHHWRFDEVVVMHAGNMGYKQGLENVVEAARLAVGSGTRTRFVLIGDGNQRASLQAGGAEVSTLEFLPPVDEEEFPAALGAADVLLVNERPGVGHMAVPSKLTSYFRSGRPVVAATDPGSLTAAEILTSGAGVCVDSDRPDLLLREAVRLGTDRALAAQMGQAGRRYCDKLLSEDEAIDRYEQLVIGLANRRREGD